MANKGGVIIQQPFYGGSNLATYPATSSGVGQKYLITFCCKTHKFDQ